MKSINRENLEEEVADIVVKNPHLFGIKSKETIQPFTYKNLNWEMRVIVGEDNLVNVFIDIKSREIVRIMGICTLEFQKKKHVLRGFQSELKNGRSSSSERVGEYLKDEVEEVEEEEEEGEGEGEGLNEVGNTKKKNCFRKCFEYVDDMSWKFRLKIDFYRVIEKEKKGNRDFEEDNERLDNFSEDWREAARKIESYF